MSFPSACSASDRVYSLMRCPGLPCVLGPHCWRDTVGKKHYKLRTQHLKTLIDFVTEGNSLQSHADIPEYLREELITEEQQRLERQPRYVAAGTPNYPPINITNVLPASETPPATSLADSTLTTTMFTTSLPSLHIPGPRDTAVKKYTQWQQAQVEDEELRMEFQKACDVALKEGLDLEQIHKDKELLGGIKRGIARRFLCDIETWASLYKSDNCPP